MRQQPRRVLLTSSSVGPLLYPKRASASIERPTGELTLHQEAAMTTPAMPGMLLSNEAALRASFDSEYGALFADARQQLGDAEALAPRVVEAAFVHAWLERSSLRTTDQLHAMLVEDVHHGAARALSRRAAAHRFGEMRHHDSGRARAHAHAETAPDPEASWSRVVGAIHGTSGTAHAAAMSAARHEAAAHVAGMVRGRSWKMPAAIGAGALVLALAVIALLDRLGAEQAAARAVDAPGARQITSSTGQIAVVTLDDSTRVRIAAESRLAVPESFGRDVRAVRLEGAASFDVGDGDDETFSVFARNVVLTAKGTEFNVRAYPQDESVTIQVREGTVGVRVGELSRDLAAGASLMVGDDGAFRGPTSAELEEATSWMDGRVVVTGRALRHALPQLKRWYNADIKVIDPKLLDRAVSIRATTEATRDAIAQAERTGGLRFERTAELMVFRDTADRTTYLSPAQQAGAQRRP
jgi:ferric-dicitrate binding protein FerR (iron transport regulator)